MESKRQESDQRIEEQRQRELPADGTRRFLHLKSARCPAAQEQREVETAQRLRNRLAIRFGG